MSRDRITWADIDRARCSASAPCRCRTLRVETATCAHCGRRLDRVESIIRRLPDRVLGQAEGLHRHLEDARAGRGILTSCPRCGRRLRAGNRAN